MSLDVTLPDDALDMRLDVWLDRHMESLRTLQYPQDDLNRIDIAKAVQALLGSVLRCYHIGLEGGRVLEFPEQRHPPRYSPCGPRCSLPWWLHVPRGCRGPAGRLASRGGIRAGREGSHQAG